MKKHLIDKNTDRLLVFFTGWGCDEYEFEHLESDTDVLLLYDYSDLNLDFDFSKYKEYNLLAFSAGVFVASIFNFNFEFGKKIALDGNPYLFDEYFGLSAEIQDILYNITEENADAFAKNYLVKTEDEYKKFHPSRRTLDSCKSEFDNLKEIYASNRQNIKDIYDLVYFGSEDKIFNLSAQKEFYGKKLICVENARHNLFFKINKYERIFDLASSNCQ